MAHVVAHVQKLSAILREQILPLTLKKKTQINSRGIQLASRTKYLERREEGLHMKCFGFCSCAWNGAAIFQSWARFYSGFYPTFPVVLHIFLSCQRAKEQQGTAPKLPPQSIFRSPACCKTCPITAIQVIKGRLHSRSLPTFLSSLNA